MPIEIPAELIAVLPHFSRRIRPADITAIEPCSGFSGAGVWKIVETRAWALRRWPVPGLTAVRIRGLHRLLDHVSRGGLPFVAAPVPSDSGETLPTVDDRWWQLEPWLPGTADFHADRSTPRLQAAMSALAHWHLAAETFIPGADSREWFGSAASVHSPAVAERRDRLQQLSSHVLAELQRRIHASPASDVRTLCLDLINRVQRLQPKIFAELMAMQHERFSLQPCLRDIWHDHVLFTDDEVTGLIDASACRRENVATDLARLIGSLVENDADGWRTALDAYRRHRPLTLAEEALVAVLDRSGVLLSAVTWLEWLFRDARVFPNRAAVLERLQHLQRRLAKLSSQGAMW